MSCPPEAGIGRHPESGAAAGGRGDERAGAGTHTHNKVSMLPVKGEVDVILDLVELVRQQEVVAATNVQKPRTTIGDLAAEHALRVQSKIQQLQVCLCRVLSMR